MVVPVYMGRRNLQPLVLLRFSTLIPELSRNKRPDKPSSHCNPAHCKSSYNRFSASGIVRLYTHISTGPIRNPECGTMAYLIRILNPQQKLPSGALREKVIEQSRPQRSQVQISSRRRGKSSPGWGVGEVLGFGDGGVAGSAAGAVPRVAGKEPCRGVSHSIVIKKKSVYNWKN